MDKWLKLFDRLSDRFLEGLKNAPLNLHKNKRLISKPMTSYLKLCKLFTTVYSLKDTQK